MSDPKYVEFSGQVWVRTEFPEGVRYQRLVRAPLRATNRSSNISSLDHLLEKGGKVLASLTATE